MFGKCEIKLRSWSHKGNISKEEKQCSMAYMAFQGSVTDEILEAWNTRIKAKISHCTLPKFPAWPRGMHSILASLSALFRSGYLFIQSVPAKFKVSRPVIGDFAPPSSPQRWNIFSHGLPTRKASGRFSHILVHLGPFGFLCGWAWWEYITIQERLLVYSVSSSNV